MMKKFLFLLLFAAVLCGAYAVDLIKNGNVNMVVVLENGSNPLLKMAGRELSDMLKKRSGATVSVINANDKMPENAYPFYLGLSDRTRKLGVDEKKIKYDGYFLKVTDKYAVIAGRDKAQTKEPYFGHTVIYCRPDLEIYEFGEKGTLHGVYKFLEKYAGVRHYMPGELGSIIPQSKDFSVPQVELYDAPAFPGRMFGAVWFSKANPDFLYWHHRLCAGGVRNPINHSYNRMNKFKATNPEYFALIGGKRDFDNLSTANHHGNLCMTNESGIKAFAELAKKFFDENPDYDIYPIVPQDGMYKVCECDNCRKLVSPHLGEKGKFSNIVYQHAIKIAEELKKTHPGKYIGVLAYENYFVVPDFEFPDNLVVCICYRRQDLRIPEKKKDIENIIKGYKAKNAKILVWVYELFNHIPPMRGIPVFYPAVTQENINFNLKNNVIGEKAEGWYYSGGGDQYVKPFDMGLPASTHINDYVRCQLLWNPSLDVKALLDEYYKLFYGPAETEMRKFWELAEELFIKRGEATVYTAEDFKQFELLMDAAIKKTDAVTPYGKRVRLLKAELAPFFKTMYAIKANKKTVAVPFVKQDLPLEFNADTVWKYATQYQFTYKNGNSVDKYNATVLRTIANEKGLALYLVSGEPNVDKLVKNSKIRDERITWKDDGYEIFLVAKDRSINLHYIITAGGNIMDGKRAIDVNVADWAWTSGLKLKQTEGKKERTSMIFIPWSDLGCTVDKLPELVFQIFRRQTDGNATTAKYHVLFPSTGFHNYSPEYFGELKLVPCKNRVKNGSFEKLSPDGSPAEWRKQGKVVKGGSDGANSLYVSAVLAQVNDFIPVKAEDDYMLYFSQKGGAGYAYVLFFGANGKTIPEPNVNFYYCRPSKDWKFRSFRGRVPKGAVKCKVMLRTFEKAPEQAAYFDNVELFCGNM